MANHEQAVADVAAALKQVLSVSPQMLYEASAKLGSELMVEAMRLQVTPGASCKQLDRVKYRASICLMLSRALIQSGRAALTTEDVASINLFLRVQAPGNGDGPTA